MDKRDVYHPYIPAHAQRLLALQRESAMKRDVYHPYIPAHAQRPLALQRESAMKKQQ